MDLLIKAGLPLGSLLATTPAATSTLDGWIAAGGSVTGCGVLVYTCYVLLGMLKARDEIIAQRDEQIQALTNQLINKCGNCELARAANKELIDK